MNFYAFRGVGARLLRCLFKILFFSTDCLLLSPASPAYPLDIHRNLHTRNARLCAGATGSIRVRVRRAFPLWPGRGWRHPARAVQGAAALPQRPGHRPTSRIGESSGGEPPPTRAPIRPDISTRANGTLRTRRVTALDLRGTPVARVRSNGFTLQRRGRRRQVLTERGGRQAGRGSPRPAGGRHGRGLSVSVPSMKDWATSARRRL